MLFSTSFEIDKSYMPTFLFIMFCSFCFCLISNYTHYSWKSLRGVRYEPGKLILNWYDLRGETCLSPSIAYLDTWLVPSLVTSGLRGRSIAFLSQSEPGPSRPCWPSPKAGSCDHCHRNPVHLSTVSLNAIFRDTHRAIWSFYVCEMIYVEMRSINFYSRY